MKRLLNQIILLAGTCLATLICKAAPGTDSLLNRYQQMLLQENPNPVSVNKWINSLQNGQWPDVNYADLERGEWKLKEHLVRLETLSIAFIKPTSPYYNQPAVQQAINSALDHWLLHKYQNPNWWHNEIGTPQLMRDIVILLRNHLSASQRTEALAVLGQLKVNGTGANLAWSADLGLHYAALTNNLVKLDSCRNLLIREIKVTTSEGLQPDGSFHQHGARLQNYHYGRSFLIENARIAWQLRNTPWAFPRDKIAILAKLLLEGDRWMARGSFIAPPTIDRAISRPGFLATGDLSSTVNMLKDLLPEKNKDLDLVIAAYQGKYSHLGFKYFPYSDYAAYSDQEYSFFLKTISTRTLISETRTNSENLKGHLLNSGNTYFIKNGKEYTDLMPVWNWSKLPGITNFNDSTWIVQKPFNGGIGNKQGGLWAMDYEIAAHNKSLKAHKIWAIYDNAMVCLIAGLTAKGDIDSAYTVLDQSRLQTVSCHPSSVNCHLFHGGFTYLPLSDKNTIQLSVEQRSGSWQAISRGQSNNLQHDSVFMPVLYHSNKPVNENTGYVVAACHNSKEAAVLAASPSWKIISNTNACQAVAFKNKIAMFAFFAKASVSWHNQTISVEQPCLVQVDESTITVSDPSCTGGTYVVHAGGHKHSFELPNTGESVTRSLTSVGF